MKTKITLEDKGQDFLEVIVEDNKIIQTLPFQTDIWKGAYVPVEMVIVGKKMPIHKPPHINFGFLNYKVESVEKRITNKCDLL